MRILFLRHPETVANERYLIYGEMDFPYTQHGEWQVSEVVKNIGRWPITQIVSSPLNRAKTLAQAVGKVLDLEVNLDARLEEMHQGIFEGLTLDEAKEKDVVAYEVMMEGDMSYVVPGGESYDMLCHRVDDFIKSLNMDETDENTCLLVVSHGGVIRTAIEMLIDAEPGFSWLLEVGNGVVIDIVWHGGTGRIKNIMNLEEN